MQETKCKKVGEKMFDLEIVEGISAIVIIIALVQVAQKTGMKTKYAPLMSLLLGILFSFGYNYFAETTWYIALITGIKLGLSAVGTYSSIKNSLESLWQQKTGTG